MADKKLCEMNLRWLRDLRGAIMDAQDCAIEATVRCTRDAPDVDWEFLEKKLDRAIHLTRYARSAVAEKVK